MDGVWAVGQREFGWVGLALERPTAVGIDRGCGCRESRESRESWESWEPVVRSQQSQRNQRFGSQESWSQDGVKRVTRARSHGVKAESKSHGVKVESKSHGRRGNRKGRGSVQSTFGAELRVELGG